MDDKTKQKLRSRADSKLEYARFYIEEVLAEIPNGSVAQRAHLESALFHLLGARDAFLHELVAYYELVIEGDVTPGNVRNALKEKGLSTKQTGDLYKLEKDEASWFSQAKRWRDHTVHKGALRHHFSLHTGTVETTVGELLLSDPETGEQVQRTKLRLWLSNMEELLERLRKEVLNSAEEAL